MAKRQLSEEQKQALRERLAKARAAKQNKNPQPQTDNQPKKETVEVSTEQLQALLQRLDNLEHNVPTGSYAQATPQFDSRGRLVGVLQEFSVKPNDYENPVERLMNEEEFLQFALKQNYELIFSVKPVNWEGRDGTKHVEPRFELDLNMFLRDENNELIRNENGTYKSIAFRKGMFFEDKEAAEYAAHDMGIDTSDPDIFNRLRYEAFKQWLLGVFTPPRPVDQGSGQRTEIFNNQEFRVIDSIRQEAI